MRNQPLRSTDALGHLVPGGRGSLSGREERDLQRSINHLSADGLVQAHAAQVDGFVRATTVNVTADVTRIAMARVGELSVYEADLARLAPHAAPRLNLLVNSFTTRAASEIHPEAWS